MAAAAPRERGGTRHRRASAAAALAAGTRTPDNRGPIPETVAVTEFLQRLPLFFAQHSLLVLAFIALLLALAVTEVMRLRRGWSEATPAMVTRLLNRENALLVDLSPRAEYEKGHIPGARHVDWEQFDPEHKDLARVKDLPVVVCCRSGVTSQRAAQRLVRAGFSRVYSLAGGMAAWRQADLPVAKGKN